MPAAVEHRHRVADAEPQHPRQVLRLRLVGSSDRLVAGIERGREEPVHDGIIRVRVWCIGAGK